MEEKRFPNHMGILHIKGNDEDEEFFVRLVDDKTPERKIVTKAAWLGQLLLRHIIYSISLRILRLGNHRAINNYAGRF